MLQVLLAERFKLKVRVEPREFPVYFLTVASKMLNYGKKLSLVRDHSTHLNASLPFSTLVGRMRKAVDLPGIDQTELTGIYRFVLDWYSGPRARPDSPVDPIPIDAGPSIFQAVEKQLGLKLTPGKTPLDFVIVESSEKLPIEN